MTMASAPSLYLHSRRSQLEVCSRVQSSRSKGEQTAFPNFRIQVREV